jgi:hypothetical protein
MQTTFQSMMIVSALVVSANCSAKLPSQPTPAPTTLVMLYGLTNCQQLRAPGNAFFNVLTYNDGLYQPVQATAVRWSSSNPAVLIPSAGSGFFTLTGVGTAEARAEYQGMSAAVVLTVPASTTLPYLEVTVGGTTGRVEYRAAFGPPTTNVTAAATFSSSDSRIATVDGSRITFPGPIGNAEIRATANGLVGSCGLSIIPRSF